VTIGLVHSDKVITLDLVSMKYFLSVWRWRMLLFSICNDVCYDIFFGKLCHFEVQLQLTVSSCVFICA